MEDNINGRYKKLKVKRKARQNKVSNKLPCFSAEAVNYNNKDCGNYKIDRFMKDVRKYGRSSTGDESNSNIDWLSEKKEVKERWDTNKKGNKKGNGLVKERVTLNEKVGYTGGKIHVNSREGLFQRGIITKKFNKGLMPPSLSARLNEDLQKMINLASGNHCNIDNKSETCRKYLRAENDIWNKMTSLNCKPSYAVSDFEDDVNEKSDTEFLTCHENDKINIENDELQENPQKVEAEVQVSGPTQTNFLSNQDDLYLKFTHFVTRSLFNSGINKTEVRQNTDSLKESLIEIYHSRSKEKTGHKESCCLEPNSDDLSLQHEESDIVPVSCTTPVLYEKNMVSCPSTSRSEEGPSREKYVFPSDSQLSDDVILRKQKQLYTSGIEFLNAVYGCGNDENINNSVKFETSCKFSPIQVDNNMTFQQGHSSVQKNDYNMFSTEVNFNDGNNNCPNECEIAEPMDSSDSWMECDKLNEKHEFNDPFVLQYFPGQDKIKYSRNDDKYYNLHSNLSKKIDTCRQPEMNESPGDISLLPTNQAISSNIVDNLYGCQSVTKIPHNGSGDSLHKSMLSLPMHFPPRKSPEIQYFPRKMF